MSSVIPDPENCISCRRGFYEECGHDPSNKQAIITIEDEEVSEGDDVSRTTRVRRNKRDDAVKDQQSTGRKRAAKLYPLDRSAPCEWQDASPDNPKGGGKIPITFGCNGKVNTQQARHHGPDKNTLNNDKGNVHRICHFHHNFFHRLNDPDYDWNQKGNVRD